MNMPDRIWADDDYFDKLALRKANRCGAWTEFESIDGRLTQYTRTDLAQSLAELTAARECIRDLAFQLGVCAELAEHYVPGNGGLTAAKARATLAKHKAEIDKANVDKG